MWGIKQPPYSHPFPHREPFFSFPYPTFTGNFLQNCMPRISSTTAQLINRWDVGYRATPHPAPLPIGNPFFLSPALTLLAIIFQNCMPTISSTIAQLINRWDVGYRATTPTTLPIGTPVLFPLPYLYWQLFRKIACQQFRQLLLSS